MFTTAFTSKFIPVTNRSNKICVRRVWMHWKKQIEGAAFIQAIIAFYCWIRCGLWKLLCCMGRLSLLVWFAQHRPDAWMRNPKGMQRNVAVIWLHSRPGMFLAVPALLQSTRSLFGSLPRNWKQTDTHPPPITTWFPPLPTVVVLW